jgi:hypothetical protein
MNDTKNINYNINILSYYYAAHLANNKNVYQT